MLDDNIEELPEGVNDQDTIHTLRTAHLNQTQLLILADQKANVLIGIMAVLMTILFTNIKLVGDFDPSLVVVFLFFLVVEFFALTLALLVLMPKTNRSRRVKQVSDIPNPLFFGFYSQFKEDEYVDYLVEKLNSNEAARRMLARDLYQIGKVLKRKYMYLKYAYVFSMAGVMLLPLSVVIFLMVESF